MCSKVAESVRYPLAAPNARVEAVGRAFFHGTPVNAIPAAQQVPASFAHALPRIANNPIGHTGTVTNHYIDIFRNID